jgi:hypothetical protein
MFLNSWAPNAVFSISQLFEGAFPVSAWNCA